MIGEVGYCGLGIGDTLKIVLKRGKK